MHQGHNIPWNMIALNFSFVCEQNHPTLDFGYTGLIYTPKSHPSQRLLHFVRKFVQTIATFAETERKKYPAKFDRPTTGILFSDEIKHKYPEYLNDQNQDIDCWIQNRAGTAGGRADVVKVLLHENQMETLLMMANHPDLNIGSLNSLSWGHHLGFSRVMESALDAYMFFNTAEATDILENGKYAYTTEYTTLLWELAVTMDRSAQQITHQNFLRECGIELGENFRPANGESVLVHKDYQQLGEYLKTLFALMYRYEVLMRECGKEVNWDMEMSRIYPLKKGLQMEWHPNQEGDLDDGRWSLAEIIP